jgi:methylase of polypeptide subunit release factors
MKDHLKTAKRALDVGSGTGLLTLAMAKMMKNKDAFVIGIEHIPQLI